MNHPEVSEIYWILNEDLCFAHCAETVVCFVFPFSFNFLNHFVMNRWWCWWSYPCPCPLPTLLFSLLFRVHVYSLSCKNSVFFFILNWSHENKKTRINWSGRSDHLKRIEIGMHMFNLSSFSLFSRTSYWRITLDCINSMERIKKNNILYSIHIFAHIFDPSMVSRGNSHPAATGKIILDLLR